MIFRECLCTSAGELYFQLLIKVDKPVVST